MPPETLALAFVHWGRMRAHDGDSALCPSWPGLFFHSSATPRTPLAPLKAGGPEQGGPSSGGSPGAALARKQMGRARVVWIAEFRGAHLVPRGALLWRH